MTSEEQGLHHFSSPSGGQHPCFSPCGADSREPTRPGVMAKIPCAASNLESCAAVILCHSSFTKGKPKCYVSDSRHRCTKHHVQEGGEGVPLMNPAWKWTSRLGMAGGRKLNSQSGLGSGRAQLTLLVLGRKACGPSLTTFPCSKTSSMPGGLFFAVLFGLQWHMCLRSTSLQNVITPPMKTDCF